MKVYLGRRYRLCASHRLFCPEWDELRNAQTFGKCANPHGHGHNYTVEVMIGGAVDTVTGMVMDLAELDAVVEREVTRPFDHTNLNLHEALEGQVPTSENFCIAIFNRLARALPIDALRQVRLEETANNFFTYTGGQSAPGIKTASTAAGGDTHG